MRDFLSFIEKQTLQRVTTWGKADYTGEDRKRVTSLDQANAVSSAVDYTRSLIHKPVLDIDFPVYVFQSSTPGHSHLYIDTTIEWDKYKRLMETMRDVGILEPGYVSASIERGASHLRLPWIKKNR